MKYQEKEIKEGINLHLINTSKFKTNLIAVFLTTSLNKENVTKNALIPAILRRGTKNMPTQEEISKNLEDMYGASFNCGIDKKGDNQILKFYMESINDNFLPKENENMLKQTINKLFEIIFNPYLENGQFSKEYLNQEKNNLKQLIEGKIDNKAQYAMERCTEEMYKGKPYSLFKYGYTKDLEKITEKDLYTYYKALLQECKIDIFISGIIDEKIYETIENMEEIKKLEPRKTKIKDQNLETETQNKEKIVTESMDVAQGKLILGLNAPVKNEDMKYSVMIYNSILGGSANSKLFQNVREKASLAYAAGSKYLRTKNNIFISCGIEIKNYEKALKLIKEQIEEIKNGEFTKEDVEIAKKGIIDGIKTINDEQSSEIVYLFGQEFNTEKININEYIEKISEITKEDILKVAKNIEIDLIYFLKD